LTVSYAGNNFDAAAIGLHVELLKRPFFKNGRILCADSRYTRYLAVSSFRHAGIMNDSAVPRKAGNVGNWAVRESKWKSQLRSLDTADWLGYTALYNNIIEIETARSGAGIANKGPVAKRKEEADANIFSMG
jgi:hypothetical protein